MGQYYYPINADKLEYLYSHNFDNGLKLMEHSYIGNNFMQAVERLLSPNGAWHKCHFVWGGDYMDEGLFLPENAPKGKNDDGTEFEFNLHSFVSEYGKNAMEGADKLDKIEDWNERKKKAEKLAQKWLKTLPKAGRYLVNHTKQVCLDLKKERGNGEKWGNSKKEIIIHPLSLLTCSGNGRGGGDYRGNKGELVGSWAGDVISLEYKLMYELLAPICFIES